MRWVTGGGGVDQAQGGGWFNVGSGGAASAITSRALQVSVSRLQSFRLLLPHRADALPEAGSSDCTAWAAAQARLRNQLTPNPKALPPRTRPRQIRLPQLPPRRP
eukprot:4803894-Prymnesium_polylepis.1